MRYMGNMRNKKRVPENAISKERCMIWVILLLNIVLLGGCAKESAGDMSGADTSMNLPGDMVPPGDRMPPGARNGGTVEIPVCNLDTSDMFSDRDEETDYDESKGILIRLNGDSVSCDSSAVEISGSTVTITDEGTYILSGILQNGSIVIDADKTDKLQVVLRGVDITCKSSAAIYVKQADKVFLTLAPDTDNRLQTSGKFVAIDDNDIDGVIFSKDDLTLNGSGALTIACDYGHGIVSKDDLVFTGGQYDIDVSRHGLSGKDSIRIAGGTFQINAKEDGIHSENDEDMTLGFVYVKDGDITIAVGDDGIHAGNQVLIEGGKIHITESNEGIEGLTVDIAGGDVTVNATDDGLNATDGSNSEITGNRPDNPYEVTENAYIKISGGTLRVTAYGDGIDSNGAFYVMGGETYVFGPENSANGSIDYASVGQITGGTFVAAGAGQMAQGLGGGGTQGVIMTNLDSWKNAGERISLKDAEGKELISCEPKTKYNCVIISCPQLQIGSSYVLTTGSTGMDVTVSDSAGVAGMPGGPGGGMGGRNPGVGNRENGMEDRNPGVGNRENGMGNRNPGAEIRENGKGGQKPDGGNVNVGEGKPPVNDGL